MKTPPPLVVHVVHRLTVGGLENGLVNVINTLDRGLYRHAIVCMTDDTGFSQRLQRGDVEIVQVHKQPGKDPASYWRLLGVLRRLQPSIVHTRNLPTLEAQAVAAMAGVRARIHGEHGRDVFDLDGSSRKYNILRRVIRPLVTHYVAVSADLRDWLMRVVGVEPGRITRICNGVDADKFHPRLNGRNVGPAGFIAPDSFVVGTVGRMATVKDQTTLVRAFIACMARNPAAAPRMRLVLVGDGHLRNECAALISAAGVMDRVWMPGERDDVAEILRMLDVFVLPSIAEGMSNTILEAMATGLPVVATRVGGNPELVDERTGVLVPRSDPDAMAQALASYCEDPPKAKRHGKAARARVEGEFSLTRMVSEYARVYASVLGTVPSQRSEG
jgi:sugar transferase (PEP-CTERM/EpsH1 system associated)